MATGGFGLNYNSGFTSGKYYGPQGPDQTQQIAQQGYQQRLGQQQQNDFGAGQSALTRQFNAGQSQADRQFSQAQNNASLQQRERESQRNAALTGQGYASQQQIAGIQADAAKYAPGLQQERFNQVFPYLRQQLGSLGGGYGGGGGGSSGGGGGAVAIKQGGFGGAVYGQDDIQHQVNATRAQNDAATASQQHALSQSLAGKGYGSNSPLALQLGVGLANQNLQTNTGAEQDLRFKSAQANANQAIALQNAAETSYANRNQEQIERDKIRAGQYNTLLGALSGLV